MTTVYSSTSTRPTCPPTTLRIEAWLDPLVDEVGHDPRSSYVEMYWLPVLGPSTTWLLRRFATHLDDVPAGVDLEMEDLAKALGLGERAGVNAPFARTLKRCVDFDMAQWRDESLAVRRHLPPLAGRHLRRLPESLQLQHARQAGLGRQATVTDRLRLHGRRLALSLLAYGEDRSAAEQQLVRWAFHPALASECATWAALEHSRRRAAQADHPAGGPAVAGPAVAGAAVAGAAGGRTGPAPAGAGDSRGRPAAAQLTAHVDARLEPPRQT
jgi:hypothetical protein